MNSQKRVLLIFLQLLSGKTINKFELMETFNKQESTIQRDIVSIEDLLTDSIYDVSFSDGLTVARDGKGNYTLEGVEQGRYVTNMTDNELLILLKIVLSTHLFNKQELEGLTNKLLGMAEDRKKLQRFIGNEQLYYQGIATEDLFERISFVTEAITQQQLIEFEYTKNGVTETFQRVPNAIYYSDMYFFMLTSSHKAQDDRDFLSLNKFRINNMVEPRALSSNNKIAYDDKFEGGLLRGRTTLPFLGNPIVLVIDFYYDPVYVLDRFAESKIVHTNEDGSVRIEIQANDGYGVKMWLLGQGRMVKVVSPKHMKDYIIQDMKETLTYYNLEVK